MLISTDSQMAGDAARREPCCIAEYAQGLAPAGRRGVGQRLHQRGMRQRVEPAAGGRLRRSTSYNRFIHLSQLRAARRLFGPSREPADGISGEQGLGTCILCEGDFVAGSPLSHPSRR